MDTFTNFWTHDPLAGANVTAEEAARVLGMSASQWCVTIARGATGSAQR